jgi:hypothetical protein
MNNNPEPFANTPAFCAALGWFYAVWSATELNIDCAIGKLKNISPEQTHTLVAKLNFGPKVEMLRSLLPNSDYQNVPELQEFLTRIEEESLRNVFAHSFLASDSQSVRLYIVLRATIPLKAISSQWMAF